MQIQGAIHVHGPQNITSPHRAQGAQPSAAGGGHVSQADQLDISHEAELISRLREIPQMRSERIAQIKSAIQRGTYETADKLDVAVDRLLDELLG